MGKKKTSVNIDEETWKNFVKFAVNRTGSTRKVSEEVEKALREYANNHAWESPEGKEKVTGQYY